MKHFDRDGKDNFVDVNNVFVGFDNNSKCCEEFGWFISKEIPTTIENGDVDIPTDGYVFDTSFFQDAFFDNNGGNESSGVVFRLTKGDDVIYLTLHNTHNGYYYHGFNMVVGGQVVESGSL